MAAWVHAFQSFVFQKVPIWQRPPANQLGEFEYNFRCLKWFFRKLPRKLRSAFFLKLRFLKIRLLLTWLKGLFKTWKFFRKIFDKSHLKVVRIKKLEFQKLYVWRPGNRNHSFFIPWISVNWPLLKLCNLISQVSDICDVWKN